MSSELMLNPVFSPSEKLKNYFRASPDIENILKSSGEPFSANERARQLLRGRWYVCHVASEPFRQIAVFVLQKLTPLAAYFQQQTVERKMKAAIICLQNGFLEMHLAHSHVTDAINQCDEGVCFPGSHRRRNVE